MGLEKIINQILASRSDIKRENLLKMIENKKKETGNFLTDESAARIAASQLGVKIAKKPTHLKMQIKDLVSGLNDVSLTGKVVSVFPPRTFKRRDWTEGKFANMIISDRSGTLRVVLWDNKADLVMKKKIQRKQTIKISHGYIREGQDGNLELHLGDRGNIRITESTRK